MENENEIIDSTTDTEIDQNVDTTLDAEAQLEALKETNRKLFERAKKAEGKLKEVKPQKEIINSGESTINPMDIIRGDAFKLHREGYDEDDIDLILRNGGRKILQDKNNAITLGLEIKREQREAERAAGQTSSSAGLSEVERKYTTEQLSNMSLEELKKILPHA
jgi:hypothetical protein